MKKTILLLSLSLLSVMGEAFAAKLVIGSRVPELKNVQWLTPSPYGSEDEQTAPILIEFYDPANKSSARFFPKLAAIKEKYATGVANGLRVVVLVGRNVHDIEGLLESYGEDYYLGVDTEAGDAHRALNVQFLPYTMLIDSDGRLYWQGNLGNITDSVLEKIK